MDRVLAHPAVYAAWQAPFVAQKFAPAERGLRDRTVRRVLDVGCGPGTNASRFAGADYIGIDLNEDYLRIARARHVGRFLQADLEREDLGALGSFDTILVNSFLHHLGDKSVARILDQLRHRLSADGAVHILELVKPEHPSLPSLMAALDRGRYARPLAEWRRLFDACFQPIIVEPYRFGFGLWAMVYFQGTAR